MMKVAGRRSSRARCWRSSTSRRTCPTFVRRLHTSSRPASSWDSSGDHRGIGRRAAQVPAGHRQGVRRSDPAAAPARFPRTRGSFPTEHRFLSCWKRTKKEVELLSMPFGSRRTWWRRRKRLDITERLGGRLNRSMRSPLNLCNRYKLL
jgi:hypothetical protein